MNNEKDEEKIKTLFIDKLYKEKKNGNYLTIKIFEEYVKFKNAVNIYLQANGAQNNSTSIKHKKNICKYNNIKTWIKIIIQPDDNNGNEFMTKKSYTYANIKDNKIPKPLGDINFSLLYYYRNRKNRKNNVMYSTTNNVFNYTSIEEKKNELHYNDEIIINKLKQYYMNYPDDFIRYIELGLPNSFRLIAWNIINNIDYSNEIIFMINENNYNANALYKKFLAKFLEKTKSDLIYRDINRTFPLQNYEKINKTKKENDEQSLYNVLKAFWNIDEEIGYCQGMNYISGFLLLITDFDEKSAFYLLISLFSETFIKRKKNNFSLRGLFIEEFPLLYFYIYIFDDLLTKYVPKLRNHLIYYEIPNDVWIIKWFQTAFITILPLSWSKKLWDNIFLSDFSFIIKFGISLCNSLSKDILVIKDQQQIMDYFRNIQIIPMNFTNPFLEKKLEINYLIEKAKKIFINIDEYLNKYENFNEKGKKFKENIYKINNIKFFDINTNTNNNFNIKKTNTTVKERENCNNKINNKFPNININTNLKNDVSLTAKNCSNKLSKSPKHSFNNSINSSDINNIKFNNNKRLCPKHKLIKKTDSQITNKSDYNKKLIIKKKYSNSNIHKTDNKNNNIKTDNKQKSNHSPKLLNSIKNKELIINTSDIQKDKFIIQTKPLNYNQLIDFSKSNTYFSNVNNESMNTTVNKNHYQKILYKRKKNMGNIPKRNGFSSSNIKQIKKKNSSNKTNEMNDILNSAKKNLSKEMSKNSNNKEKEIKVKNTIMKNKIASISTINGIKNNLENFSRNNLINELKRRKQYLNKQVKCFLTNDSMKYSNNSFINSEEKKMINLNSNSKNNIKENEKNNTTTKFHQIRKNTKPTKYIKIKI